MLTRTKSGKLLVVAPKQGAERCDLRVTDLNETPYKTCTVYYSVNELEHLEANPHLNGEMAHSISYSMSWQISTDVKK